MTSLEDFVMKVKPALDAFLRYPTKENLGAVDEQLSKFTWAQLQIFHVQILLPLVLKLEKLNGYDQELQTGTLNCIRLVVSKLYLKEVQALQTMLVIVTKQIRDCDNAKIKPNLSEEIKLAAVECITMLLQRSTTDVLEQYYTQESALFLSQILLTLVEFIQYEKYKKLIISSLLCLMTIFYVNDESADLNDVVLRGQVADSLFIFLPKIVTVLFKTCLSDETLGETLLTTAVKALARILALIFEDTDDCVLKSSIDMNIFKQQIMNEVNAHRDVTQVDSDNQILGNKIPREGIKDHLKQMQTNGRSKLWFGATSRKLKVIFRQLGETLRGHQSVQIRHEYAKMCCTLIQRCGNNLRENFIYMLENVIAMSEDEDGRIATMCQQTLGILQSHINQNNLFDESAELLFDEHLTRLPRIIARCEESEQYAEFMFLKGFLHNISTNKLQTLLSLPQNLDIFCSCLLAAADLKVSRDLLVEEHALRVIGDQESQECTKLRWRQLKNLCSQRCVTLLVELCALIGRTDRVNKIVFDYFIEMLTQQSPVLNEILLILIWMVATENKYQLNSVTALVKILLSELLEEKHWHLALQSDEMRRLKVEKPSDWFVDRTPGLYESAVEIRTQDCDSDDEIDAIAENCVSIADAQFNVLHTCITLDGLGHCATALGEQFEHYLFRCLHKVLLKVGSSNTIIYQSANFALISMQRALKFSNTTYFIESYTDYITYHLNRILRRNPESKSAVEILIVVLQLSSRHALPYLDSIFRTIREECGKIYQSQNVLSYLKVFQAFLKNISQWQNDFQHEIGGMPMQIDAIHEVNLLQNCLDILKSPPTALFENNRASVELNTTTEPSLDQKMDVDTKSEIAAEAGTDLKPELPQHIKSAKEIIDQVIKMVSSSLQAQQILALECLICGLPLLRDYEDDLLPLVHRLWQPLVERFKQKDALVLNRCFTLLGVLALCAKEFISKKSLDDVIPFLKQFLIKAAKNSQAEMITAQTQEYKLQTKLLQEFPFLIQYLVIEGKQLNEISDVVSLYMSDNQPNELQQLSANYFKCLKTYNGPLIYLIMSKKSHLKEYKTNVSKILNEYEITVDQKT